MGSPFVHIEIPVSDFAKAQKFYGDVFGWTFEYYPEMKYMLFNTGTPPAGGMMIPVPGQPGGVLNHLGVKSVDESILAIQKAGGKILMPKTAVGDIGWFAVFSDPDGNVLAIFEQKESEGVD
jgi:hypothetical protein